MTLFAIILIWNSQNLELISLAHNAKILTIVQQIFFDILIIAILLLIILFWRLTNQYMSILNYRYKFNIKCARSIISLPFLTLLLTGTLNIYSSVDWLYHYHTEQNCSSLHLLLLCTSIFTFQACLQMLGLLILATVKFLAQANEMNEREVEEGVPEWFNPALSSGYNMSQ